MIVFMLLMGLLKVHYNDFDLYYRNDIRKLTKIQEGYLHAMIYVGSLLGAVFFGMYLKHCEYRTLIFLSFIFGILEMGVGLIWLYRLNLPHLGDYAYLNIQTLIFKGLEAMLFKLPVFVVLSKLVPKGIESSAFALYIGLDNLSHGVLPSFIGAKINDWFVKLSTPKMIEED